MTEQRNLEFILPYDHEDRYDYEKISRIVESLDYLRCEAKTTGSDDVYMLVNSTFNIIFTMYYMFVRSGHIIANEN